MRLYSKYTIFLVFGFIFISLNISIASDPREWSPTWKLPPGKKPENIIDQDITIPGDVKKSQFFSPISCGACHPEIFKMWSGSTHANAWRNP
ncbi:MAG: hypothetical protein AABY38_01125, partial [Planctomycetota bacterium]